MGEIAEMNRLNLIANSNNKYDSSLASLEIHQNKAIHSNAKPEKDVEEKPEKTFVCLTDNDIKTWRDLDRFGYVIPFSKR